MSSQHLVPITTYRQMRVDTKVARPSSSSSPPADQSDIKIQPGADVGEVQRHLQIRVLKASRRFTACPIGQNRAR